MKMFTRRFRVGVSNLCFDFKLQLNTFFASGKGGSTAPTECCSSQNFPAQHFSNETKQSRHFPSFIQTEPHQRTHGTSKRRLTREENISQIFSRHLKVGRWRCPAPCRWRTGWRRWSRRTRPHGRSSAGWRRRPASGAAAPWWTSCRSSPPCAGFPGDIVSADETWCRHDVALARGEMQINSANFVVQNDT